MSMPSAIRVRAPGKLMLCGEYAVLMGAPALLACVDRYADATVAAAEGDVSSVQLAGFSATSAEFRMQRRRVRWGDDVDAGQLRLVSALLEQFPPPVPVTLSVDSSGFYDDGRKLGLGSSAAVAAGLGIALAQFGGHGAVLEGIISAHRRFQRGKGSGADVCAVARGGVVVFRHHPQRLVADRTRWPAGLLAQPVRCPASADTVDHIARFSTWLKSNPAAPEAIERTVETVDAVVNSWRSATPAAIIAAMNVFLERMHSLDEAAKLGYLAGGHRQLLRLAQDTGVFYKPCGAGGGDYGIALAEEREALDAFRALAGDAGYGVDAMSLEDNAPSISRVAGGVDA